MCDLGIFDERVTVRIAGDPEALDPRGGVEKVPDERQRSVEWPDGFGRITGDHEHLFQFVVAHPPRQPSSIVRTFDESRCQVRGRSMAEIEEPFGALEGCRDALGRRARHRHA